MAGGDGTGPVGMGPMTGRAAGFCAGFGVPGYMNPMPGRGFGGRGRGFGGGGGRGGRGHRNRFHATGLTGWQRTAMGYGACGSAEQYIPAAGTEQQIDALKAQAEYFEDELKGLRKRIEELQAAAGRNKGEPNG